MATHRILWAGAAVAATVATWYGMTFLGMIEPPQSAVAPLLFSDSELDACAAEAEFTSTLHDNGGDRQAAASSLAVEGYQGIVETARAYDRRFGARMTVYDQWADAAPGICLKHRIAGEKIIMPDYRVPTGYHVFRSPDGSAAEVRDGDPNPAFGCITGYHYVGFPARPDGSGGCQKD